MKKISQFLRFFIRANIIILFSIFVGFTMVSFIYYYYHLKQDPMHYFSWWYGIVSSFKIMDYIYYIAALEIILLILAVVFVRKDEDVISGHEEYK